MAIIAAKLLASLISEPSLDLPFKCLFFINIFGLTLRSSIVSCQVRDDIYNSFPYIYHTIPWYTWSVTTFCHFCVGASTLDILNFLGLFAPPPAFVAGFTQPPLPSAQTSWADGLWKRRRNICHNFQVQWYQICTKYVFQLIKAVICFTHNWDCLTGAFLHAMLITWPTTHTFIWH